MFPHLIEIPIPILAAIIGIFGGVSFSIGAKRGSVMAISVISTAAVFGLLAYVLCGFHGIPVQSYGTMVLLGFFCGTRLATRRSVLIGIDPKHCIDICIYGLLIGLVGARLFYIIMNWSDFNPYEHGWAVGFSGIFKVWDGGLVFYGAFLPVLAWAWLYCKRHSLPAMPFLDLAAPGLLAGYAFGRIGCFLSGCCYGKACDLPWAVTFPRSAPVYEEFIANRFSLDSSWEGNLPCVHPTQLYAALAATLTAAFLYTYWPQRKYDGQVFSFMLIMAGTTRFFEELLRADEVAVFPSLSHWMTIAQWISCGMVLFGMALIVYFRRRKSGGVPK